MANQTTPRSSDSDPALERSSIATYPGTPRWVKVSGVVVLLLVLLFGGFHLSMGGMGSMAGLHAPPAPPASNP